MDEGNINEQHITKSISCSNLPENFIIDKQIAKEYFSKFGAIKRFILRPKRYECTVEYETTEGAAMALKSGAPFKIFPTPKQENVPSNTELDPEVQAELDSMTPASIRTQNKQAFESFIKQSERFPQPGLRPRVPPAARQHEIYSNSADPRLISAARNELETLAKKPARSAEEKLQVLDARDKLYRLINAKTTDIKKATSTQGTCKDMCPEKERYMREARQQVASFEMNSDESTMDVTKMIKQYSRSSADQEAPLPHELRSEKALRTTMTYLLHNIINLCDEGQSAAGDWFHFVWDRTRGIRKEITQQELCSPVTVELMEQCARFHIHCSARLVSEDPAVFDQRINTENLTKCLQSLKYIYNDLKQRNVTCSNEAEFRAYVILLNLNESGNFLWEIKQLEKSILKTKEIKFALDVYFAIANNNYVKFFNLVREATYMNACILLRYFTQVRLKAIDIIMRTYTPRKAGFNFNISYLTEILAFEDFEATVSFLTFHGLRCNRDDDLVFLDRNSFGVEDAQFQMERAYSLVEAKMESTVAEAICGGPLPDPQCFQKLTTHCSFDENGFLKRESFYAEDQNGPSPNVPRDGVFKVPAMSPPASPARSMMQQPMTSRLGQKRDQPDGVSASENVFLRVPASSGASTTKPATKNVFGGNFGTKSENSPFGKSSEHIFTSPNIFGPVTHKPGDSIFGVSKGPAFVTSTPLQTRQQQTVSASSLFGGGAQFPSSGNSMLASFVRPITPAKTVPGFSFTAQVNQQPNKEELERKRLERAASERVENEKQERLRLEAEAEVQRLKAQQELEEKKKIEEERRDAEEKFRQEIELERIHREHELEKLSQSILESLCDEVVTEAVNDEARKAIALYVKLPEEFYDALEWDVVVMEIYKIYNQEFLAYVNQMKRKYEILHKFFQKWHHTTVTEIVKREKLSAIGCTILNASIEEQANELHHSEQELALANMKQYLTGSPQPIKLPNFDQLQKIDLFKELNFKSIESSNNLYWKFLISIPIKNEENCAGFSCFINKWLEKTLEFTDGNFYIQQRHMRPSRKISICVRKIQGTGMIDEKGQCSPNALNNSHGILFITTSANLQASRKRLQAMLNSFNNALPVSVIVYKNQVNDDDEQELSRYFDLSSEGNVIDFEVSIYYEHHEKSKNLSEVIVESLQFLNDCHVKVMLDKHYQLFDLRMQHMIDFFQIAIGEEMWQRINLSCKNNENFRKQMTSFNCVIHLYNNCIDKIVTIIRNDFRSLPSLPKEFCTELSSIDQRIPQSYEHFPNDWKSVERQQLQISFVRDLQLTKMLDDDFKNFGDLKTKMQQFLSLNMSSQKEKVHQSIMEKIINILYRQELSNEDEVVAALKKFSWLEILGEIVVGKFDQIYQRNQQIPSTFIYNKTELKRYRDVPWWYTFQKTTNLPVEPEKKKQRTSLPVTTQDMQLVLASSANTLQKLTDKIHNYKQVSTTTREVSKNFDQYLYDYEENIRNLKRRWQEKFHE